MNYAAGQLFSALTGRQISFAIRNPTIASKAKQVYGTYKLDTSGATRVVQGDLLVFCSLGGALLGLPADAIKERAEAPTLDASISDAVHEIFNIASSIVTDEDRAVFQKIYFDVNLLPEAANQILAKPVYNYAFTVTIDNKEIGAFSVLAGF